MSEMQYFATKAPRECVAECMSRTADYYKWINEKGIKFVWMLVHLFKHSATERQTLSTAVGEYSELQQVRINDYRNLLVHKAGIIKNQRATWEAQAINDDVDSLAQTKIAKAILEDYTNHKGYDHKFNELVNFAVSYGEAFMLQTWDAYKGKLTATLPTGRTKEDGTPETANFYEGDVDARVYEPIDVIRDCNISNQDQNKWYIFRDRVNKWELAAKHPELYDKIINKTLEFEFTDYYTDVTPYNRSQDLITMYTFVHKKTAAIPNGRIIQYIDEDIILSSTELNYDDVPYHRIIDQAVPGTNFSYTDAFDLLQVEDLCDGLWSTIITNQRMFGVQNIIMPKGSDISETDLMGMMNLITYDPMTGGKPEALQLLATPKEIFETLGMLEQKKNIISGVGPIAQGQPPNDVSSGVAISMLQSLNVQYNQGLQGSYVEVMSSVGTALINILKQNAKTERLIEFTGTSSRSLLQKFTGKDIDSVSRVRAVPGNPLTQTIQGRFTLAQQLASMNLIHNPQELLEVLESGNLDVATEAEEMALIYAQQENEALQRGENVQVFQFDDHITHLRKHFALTQDISVRSGKVQVVTDPTTGQTKTTVDPASNPEGQKVMTATINHIMEHVQYLQNPNVSGVLAMFGFQTGPSQNPARPPAAAAAPPAQAPVVHVGAQGPSPTAGVRPSPAAAVEQPAAAVQSGQVPHGPTGTVPTAAIKTAQKISSSTK